MKILTIRYAIALCFAIGFSALSFGQAVPSPTPPCGFDVVGPWNRQSAPGNVFAGRRLTPGQVTVWVAAEQSGGKLGMWYPFGPFTVKAGDKYLVQIRDGVPPTVTWLPNDARLGQYSQPAGVGVPYIYNGSDKNYGVAICQTMPVVPPVGFVAGPPCTFDVVGPWNRQTAPGNVFAGRRLAPGLYAVWVSPKDKFGNLGKWTSSGPYTVRAGNKYLVQIRDGGPPVVTWLENDARLGQYSQPTGGVGVPYYYNGSEQLLDYAIAVCPTVPPGAAGTIVIGTEKGFLFGFSLAEGKRLTYSKTGSTNSTVASIEGLTAELGSIAGKTVETETPTGNGGVRAVWVMNNVRFTQTLEPVTTSSGKRDAVVVRWDIRNEDSREHRVGLRIQLDTLIGQNDGVPFMAPGLPGLVTTSADFPKQGAIPDYVQALEVPNLKNPGTVAHLTIKVQGVEPPDRVLLTAWPGGTPAWNIPITPMGSDSAVVLYWSEKTLGSGQSRSIGFTYGLGNVTSTEGRIGATVATSVVSGRDFPVTAYVKNPQPGETLTIDPPSGVSIRGDKTLPVPPPPAESKDRTSVVTWQASAARPGEIDFTIRSSTGDVQRQHVSVAGDSEPAPTPPTAAVASLIAELADSDAAMRLKAAKVLGRMGASAAEALPKLRERLQDPDEDVRKVAGDSVRAIEAAMAAAAPQHAAIGRWIEQLKDQDEAVRLQAAKHLGQVGPAAKDAIPALERCLTDTDPDVRRVAAASLGRIRGTDTPPIENINSPRSGAKSEFRFKGKAMPLHVDAAGKPDADFFNLTFAANDAVQVEVKGSGNSDLDLWVQDAQNKVLVKEIGDSDQERGQFASAAGVYSVQVRPVGLAANPYVLSVKAEQSASHSYLPLAFRRNMPAEESDEIAIPVEKGKSYRVLVKGTPLEKLTLTASVEGAEVVGGVAIGDQLALTLSCRSTGTARIAVRNTAAEPARYIITVAGVSQ
jgi:HEAT repeat protein